VRGAGAEVGDAALAARAAAGEDRAWRDLLGRYRGTMYRCILKAAARSGAAFSPADADDAFGEACVTLLQDGGRRLKAWDPSRGAALGSWLGLLTTRATLDYLRKRGHCAAETMENPGADAAAPGPGPFEAALDAERAAWARSAARKLPRRDRELLDLLAGEGLAPSQAALKMDVSVKTIHTKLHKVRLRLTKAAARDGVA
jgi:RNA polymerase sigma-70 factor (ECF subfamily)